MYRHICICTTGGCWTITNSSTIVLRGDRLVWLEAGLCDKIVL